MTYLSSTLHQYEEEGLKFGNRSLCVYSCLRLKITTVVTHNQIKRPWGKKNEFYNKQKKATTKCYFRVAHNLCFDNGRCKPFAMKINWSEVLHLSVSFQKWGSSCGNFLCNWWAIKECRGCKSHRKVIDINSGVSSFKRTKISKVLSLLFYQLSVVV